MTNLIQSARAKLSDRLWRLGVDRHRSTMGWRAARRYASHLRSCRSAQGRDVGSLPEFARRAGEAFRRDGFAAFETPQSREVAQAILSEIRAEEARGAEIWNENGAYTGDIVQRFPIVADLFRDTLGPFIEAVYGSGYRLFYGTIYKSERRQERPTGSQRWHSDGGPGTCIILMVTLGPVGAGNGGIRLLPWPRSRELLVEARGALRAELEQIDRSGLPPAEARRAARELKCDYYEAAIESRLGDEVVQPEGGPGLIIPFTNNLLHCGGFPLDPAARRDVMLFHVYPGVGPADFELYRRTGIRKTEGLPADPAAIA